MADGSQEAPLRSLYLGDKAYVGGKLLENLLLFGRICKGLGLDATPTRMIDAAQALQYVPISRKGDVYQALRCLFVSKQKDIPLFDEAFRIFWRVHTESWSTLDLRSLGERRLKRKTQFLPPLQSTPEDEADSANKPAPDEQMLIIVPTHSQQEVLRHKDFAQMTGEELAQARQFMERLRWTLGTRKTRRFHAGSGQDIDLRRMLRANLRYGGELFHLPTQQQRVKPRPLVIISDISGSMERYTRLLLHFMHTLSNSIYRVETFVYSTRLTRITRSILRRSVDAALAEVGARVKDWGGGTRTGEALHTFNYRWARRVLGHGAVVLLITDGWDRGDPLELATEARRLSLNCERLIWLNPLLSSAAYEPINRGAAAILPHVDMMLPVHNLASLEALARELSIGAPKA